MVAERYEREEGDTVMAQLTFKRKSKAWRIIGFFLREGSALVLAAALIYILWVKPLSAPATVNEAMWYVFALSVIVMVYTALQAFAAVTQPLGKETASLVDFLISVIPLLVVIYAGVEWFRGALELSNFQLMAVILVASAVVLDMIIFTWVSLRINKLANEFVRMN